MAYIKRKRSTSYRPGMSKKRRSVLKRRSRFPARLRQLSKRTFAKRRRVQRMLRPLSETKLIACSEQNEVQPVPIQTGAQSQFIAFTLGVNQAFTGDTTVGGTQIPEGTGADERIGQYVYYKKTHAVIRIEANQGVNAPPIQVRCIMFKARRSNNPAGITPAWDNSGFMDNQGNSFGHATSGKTGLDLMMQPLNKRSWVIYRDSKFILQPYNSLTTGDIIYNHYGAAKQLMFNMPHYCKGHFPANALSPDDIDLRYTIVMYFHTLGRSGIPATALEASFRGTTSVTDI